MRKAASGILPLVAVERKTAKPLHRQVYDSYRAAIVEGRLRPGQRLPSTRVLASEIGISRFPVLNAYAQLLAEGYLESRIGAGTVVSSSLPDQVVPRKPAHTLQAAIRSGPRAVAQRCSMLPRTESFPWARVWGPFRVGQVAFEQFPIQVWQSLVARRCKRMDERSAHYGDRRGFDALWEAIANYLRTARSVRCEASQVVIVNGSQQALEISARVLLDTGSRVWVEEPCYRLARQVFALNGCRLVPVAVDSEGLDVAAGVKACRKAQAAFVTPSHQFPLGVTMSAARRLQLLDWAQTYGGWIIEDDYDSEYRYESSPIASLQGLDANARVIYIGTFSKVLFPSLRLGYLVLPPDLVDRFLLVRRAMDLGPPTLYQEVLADFIEEGHFARHIRRMRMLYGEVRKVLVDRLHKLGDKVEVLGDEAGMHLTIALKNRQSDLEISERAALVNLSLWPLSSSYLGPPRNGFILGYGGTTLEELPAAVGKLHTLLK